jgi:hypothetical protein
MASGDPPNTSREKGGKREKLSQKEQFERFKETARKLEADETGEKFEKAMQVIASASAKP